MSSSSAAAKSASKPKSAVQAAIGVDIGGTKICSAVVTSQFADNPRLSNVQMTATPQNAELFLEAIETMAEELRRLHPQAVIGGIGISTAGAVNSRAGEIVGSIGNLPFLSEIPSSNAFWKSASGYPCASKTTPTPRPTPNTAWAPAAALTR